MTNRNTEFNDVSLIIATYNEEESLGYVLDEIKDYNIGEIIIVDKNSTDNTTAAHARIATKTDCLLSWAVRGSQLVAERSIGRSIINRSIE